MLNSFSNLGLLRELEILWKSLRISILNAVSSFSQFWKLRGEEALTWCLRLVLTWPKHFIAGRSWLITTRSAVQLRNVLPMRANHHLVTTIQHLHHHHHKEDSM